MDISSIVTILSTVGFNGILLFFIKRYVDKKDVKQTEVRRHRESDYKKLENAFETIRLLAYARMSEEIERLLSKGYATPAERRILDVMYKNYKEHGWNGDMDSRLNKVYGLRTDHE